MMLQVMELQQLQFLAQSMIKEGVKNVAAGGDPMAIKRGIDKAVEASVKALKDISSPVNGKEDIARSCKHFCR